MTPIQLHLMINHITVIGYPLALIIGCSAFIFRIVQYRYLVYILTVLCSIAGILSYFSGQRAMEQKYQMVFSDVGSSANISSLGAANFNGLGCFSRVALERHENIAQIALVFFIFNLLLGLISITICIKWPRLEKLLGAILLLFLAVSTVWIFEVAHEGGKINHPALR